MKADHSPSSQTDPLGLARFLKQKDSKTKTSINEATIKESKDATGTTTSESKDATATEEYVTINGQRFMTAVLLRVGGASQPSEEEADSQGDRSAHGRLIQEADRNASQPSKGAADEEDEDSSVESRHVLRREFDGWGA